MARYSNEFKERAVARLLPPESAEVSRVSREIGVSVATLERWRADALSRPARERAWTAAARLEAVIATAAMDEAQRLVPRERGFPLGPRAVARERDGGAGAARGSAGDGAGDACRSSADQGAGEGPQTQGEGTGGDHSAAGAEKKLQAIFQESGDE